MSVKIFCNFMVILHCLLKYLCIFLLFFSSALDTFGYVTLDGYVYLPGEGFYLYLLTCCHMALFYFPHLLML